MLEVLCAEDSLLCFDGSSTCAWFTAMLDGDFVLSKAHAYKSNRKQQIRLSSTPSYLASKYDGAEGEKKIIGFEIIVFGQILPHKIGVLDLRSPNSQIQFLYTPNTTPIKDGLRAGFVFSMRIFMVQFRFSPLPCTTTDWGMLRRSRRVLIFLRTPGDAQKV